MHSIRRLRAVGAVGATLGSALGIGVLACSGGIDTTPSVAGTDGATANDGATSMDGGTVRIDDGGGVAPATCTNPAPVVIGGKDTGFVRCDEGYQHRAKIVECPSLVPRPASTCGPGKDAGLGFECGNDSDCTAKPNGICRSSAGGAFTCSCTYGCVRDSDCMSGQICECGDPVGFCVPVHCTDDSKCAAPSLCASVVGGYGGCSRAANTYLCQTAADRCTSDNDCGKSGSFQSPICGFSEDAGARACGDGPLACPGRPFLVAGAPRVAPLTRRGDWRGRGVIAPVVDHLEGAERAALADHWSRTGQMEHASVAAFARFALELVALGAPSWALAETATAMADETAHAELAFALASRYRGTDVGPAPLRMDGALGDVTDRSVFATLLREGCIGETIAAISATHALEDATDPAVREALGRIAADETRHAELAWRAASWLVARGDDAFRAWAAVDFEDALAERQASTSTSTSPEAERFAPIATANTAGHGLVSESTERELARAALEDVVTPCALRLLFSSKSPQPRELWPTA